MTMWARNTDPETSHMATDGSRFSDVQAAILGLIKAYGPMSDETLIAYWRLKKPTSTTTDQSIRSRRSELVRMEQLKKVNITTTKRGRAAIVWGINND